MLFWVIGIVLVVAVGAIVARHSRHPEKPQEAEQGAAEGEHAPSDAAPKTEQADPAAVPDSVVLTHADTPGPAAGKPQPEISVPAPSAPPPAPDLPAAPFVEEIAPLQPLLAAAPISSPHALNSATYASVAPPSLSGDSPYAFGNTEEAKAKPEPTLLRWSGKTGTIQIGDLTIRGPVTYWSEGPASMPEPSCVDITLPVDWPEGESAIPSEGALSYREMTPLQRGTYLLWLAGGRIQPPSHIVYPMLWLFGLERRVLADRLDIAICIGEAFRLLPLIRWETLRQNLIKFISWMAAKAWLPEEQLLAFSRSLPSVPPEILNMLLRPYVDAKLSLPSVIAFTLMRASSLAGGQPTILQHSDELLGQFATRYKNKCQGGLLLPKAKGSIFVAYVPANPSLAGDKNTAGGVLELPDFLKDPSDFAPLVAVWHEFLKSLAPAAPETPGAAEEVENRPDWDAFVRGIGEENAEDSGDAQDALQPQKPVMTNLGALADLMRIERPRKEPGGEFKKPGAADRKKIAEAAQIEGFIVMPNLGIAGKEYQWDDPVMLTPAETGIRLSQDSNAAALLFEFACALAEPDAEAAAKLRARLDDYFSLSSDDRARLEALSAVLAAHPADPDNIGECFQFWLTREQRGIVRDFLSGYVLGPLPEEERADRTRTACTALGVAVADPPPVTAERPLDLGAQVSKVLAPLFRD